MKKKLIIALITLFLISVVSVGFLGIQGKDDKDDKSYFTVAVQTGNLRVTVNGTGVVTASQRQTVRAGVNDAVVDQLYVDVGDVVTEGQPLVRLSNATSVDQVQQAQLDLKAAELKLKEILNLGPNEPIPTEFTNDLVIAAPISGRVTIVRPQTGVQLGAGTVVASIINDQDMNLVINVSSAEVGKIKLGQQAEVFIQEFMSTLPGVVAEVSSESIQGDTTFWYPVKVKLQNPGLLKPGMEGSATIKTESGDLLRSGSLEALEEINIKMNFSGEISEVLVKSGQRVEKGDTLFIINSPGMLTQVESQLIKIQQAKLSLARRLEEQKQLTITSPIGGTIVDLAVTRGDTVTPSTMIATIADYSKALIEIEVDELDIGKIFPGQKAYVSISALPGQRFTAEVVSIAGEGNTASGVTVFPVLLELEEAEGLRGGLTANATIVVEDRVNVLRVPVEALSTYQGTTAVQVIRNGEPLWQPVKTGITGDYQVEILDGLREGEQVIVSGAGASTSSPVPGTIVPGMEPGMRSSGSGGGGSGAGRGGGGGS
ncbi:MAG: efflux RND transporter periplasmic adaptor subunit [Bacillota bacterium]